MVACYNILFFYKVPLIERISGSGYFLSGYCTVLLSFFFLKLIGIVYGIVVREEIKYTLLDCNLFCVPM